MRDFDVGVLGRRRRGSEEAGKCAQRERVSVLCARNAVSRDANFSLRCLLVWDLPALDHHFLGFQRDYNEKDDFNLLIGAPEFAQFLFFFN